MFKMLFQTGDPQDISMKMQ